MVTVKLVIVVVAWEALFVSGGICLVGIFPRFAGQSLTTHGKAHESRSCDVQFPEGVKCTRICGICFTSAVLIAILLVCFDRSVRVQWDLQSIRLVAGTLFLPPHLPSTLYLYCQFY